MGAGISEGDPRGTHKAGGAPRGVGHALHPCGPLVQPPGAISVPEILKYSIKNHTKFSGHLENFYFRDIFYCMDNSENRKIKAILLYLF
jgi:hypothetical protein